MSMMPKPRITKSMLFGGYCCNGHGWTGHGRTIREAWQDWVDLCRWSHGA